MTTESNRGPKVTETSQWPNQPDTRLTRDDLGYTRARMVFRLLRDQIRPPTRPDHFRNPTKTTTQDDPKKLNEEIAFPNDGRVASIDFGTVRIGVAVCDPDRILASPLEVHPAANWRDDGDYFRRLAASERIAGFVVGLPIHCDGGESEKSKLCREFARWLADETKLPVRLFDERFTTAAAKQRMAGGGYSRKGKKKRIDAIAALVLLESFLEACRYQGHVAGQPVDAKPEGDEALD